MNHGINNKIPEHEGEEPKTRMKLLDIWDQGDAANDNENEAIEQAMRENESNNSHTRKLKQFKCLKCDYSTCHHMHTFDLDISFLWVYRSSEMFQTLF